jgi:hypothetical protein
MAATTEPLAGEDGSPQSTGLQAGTELLHVPSAWQVRVVEPDSE